MNALALITLALATAGSPPDTARLTDAIDAAERIAADSAKPAAERRAAAEEAAAQRAALLETLAPDDAARAVLLVDTAWSHLGVLGWDATDTAVLVGLPTQTQLDRARTAVREASAALRLARQENWSMRPAREVADLADATARTLLLAAATDERTARRLELAGSAVRAVETAPGEGVTAERRASLLAHLGLALARRGQPGDAAAAREALAVVLADERAWPITRVEAQLASIAGARTADAWRAEAERVRVALAAEPFVREGRADPLLVLRAVEAVAAAGRAVARYEGGSLAAEALAWPIDLLDRDDLGLTPGERRALAQPMIARIAAGLPAESLPDEAIEARAALPDLETPEVRSLLDVTLERGMHESAWRLASALAEESDADQLRAARALRTLARADSSREAEATRAALALLRALDDRYVPGAREAYTDALDDALSRDLADRADGLWHLERARLIAADITSATAESLADAVQLAARAQGETLPDAAALIRAIAPIADARLAARQDLGEPVADARIELWRDAMGLFIRAGVTDTDAQHRFAAALIEHGLEQYATEAGPMIDADARPMLHGRWLAAVGRCDEAAVVLADAVPETPRSRRDWAAWAALLECTIETEPSRVRAHVARLTSIDQSLGGEPWASRIAVLAE